MHVCAHALSTITRFCEVPEFGPTALFCGPRGTAKRAAKEPEARTPCTLARRQVRSATLFTASHTVGDDLSRSSTLVSIGNCDEQRFTSPMVGQYTRYRKEHCGSASECAAERRLFPKRFQALNLAAATRWSGSLAMSPVSALRTAPHGLLSQTPARPRCWLQGHPSRHRYSMCRSTPASAL